MDTKIEKNRELGNLINNVQESDAIPLWTFSETLAAVSFIVFIYLAFVKQILPKFMKNRQAYQLNRLLLIYNALQVAASTYIVLIYTKYILQHGVITTRCPQGDDLKAVISDIFPYFIAKHIDLLDTVFFIIRKKDNQVTFLHVFHHSVMITWTWFHYMYHPCDHFVVVGLMNSFVHVIMYAYYALSSLGPEYAKFLWWKKYLTKVQLIQFVLVVLNLYYQQKLTPCPIPASFHYFCLFSINSFFFLFMNFYLRSYGDKMKKRVELPANLSKCT